MQYFLMSCFVVESQRKSDKNFSNSNALSKNNEKAYENWSNWFCDSTLYHLSFHKANSTIAVIQAVQLMTF